MVAERCLVGSDQKLELLWAGSNNGMEQALIERAGVAFHGIDTGKVRGVNLFTGLASVGKIIDGARQSLALLRQLL